VQEHAIDFIIHFALNVDTSFEMARSVFRSDIGTSTFQLSSSMAFDCSIIRNKKDRSPAF
jgi:hypothetical protein